MYDVAHEIARRFSGADVWDALSESERSTRRDIAHLYVDAISRRDALLIAAQKGAQWGACDQFAHQGTTDDDGSCDRCGHQPTVHLELPLPRRMIDDLAQRLGHGPIPARPESPQLMWYELLGEVRGIRSMLNEYRSAFAARKIADGL